MPPGTRACACRTANDSDWKSFEVKALLLSLLPSNHPNHLASCVAVHTRPYITPGTLP